MITIVVSGQDQVFLVFLYLTGTQIFIILGIAVNCGGNKNHEYIGARNWTKGDAPFVDGIGGFASVFVTASFA